MSVKTLCLGALSLQDGTGYDIKKLFETAFSHFHSASYGSIYPALKQLETDGLVDCRVQPGERHPDRKLFSLTDSGRETLLSELTAMPASEQVRSNFLVLLFFAHLLPTNVLRAKLDEIERQFQDELDYLESLTDCRTHTAGIGYTIEQGIRVYRTKLELLRERCDQLLKDHRVTPKEWSDQEPCGD